MAHLEGFERIYHTDKLTPKVDIQDIHEDWRNMKHTKNYSKAQKQSHKIWKVAVYIRLSRDDGNDESLSVTNQRKIIHEYLENNFDGDYTIIDHYVDDGLSGTTD